MITIKSIGERIINLRENKDWNQRDLARKIGLNFSVMNRIESGERAIRDHELDSIATALGVTTDYILGRPDRSGIKEDDKKSDIIKRIKMEFPDADLMFSDLASFTADDMQDVYDFIKFKKSQKED
ncbi:MAG TPA: helix-turn-helix domain-containing protein [Atopostipes sp.]|nr:helix-turn-helix domain-containing protein [Atopostipes sp.]